MNYIRTAKKIILEKLSVIVSYYKIGKEEITSNIGLFFTQGLISIKESNKMQIINAEDGIKGTPISQNIPDIYKVGNTLLYEASNQNNYALFQDGNIKIKTDKLTIEANNIEINCSNFILNGVAFSVISGKLFINNKEVAVIGGEIVNNIINSSGQQ